MYYSRAVPATRYLALMLTQPMSKLSIITGIGVKGHMQSLAEFFFEGKDISEFDLKTHLLPVSPSRPTHPPTHLTSDNRGPCATAYWFFGIELESWGHRDYNQRAIVSLQDRLQTNKQYLCTFPHFSIHKMTHLSLAVLDFLTISFHVECIHFLCIEHVLFTVTDHRMITILIRPMVQSDPWWLQEVREVPLLINKRTANQRLSHITCNIKGSCHVHNHGSQLFNSLTISNYKQNFINPGD